MGAATFNQYADGSDPDAAFDTARDDARHEHGHGGYTGTLAEKDGYVIITATPMDPEQAQTLAADLIDRADPRIDDKWGPAGAIAVRQPTRTVTVDQLAGSATNTWPLDEQALAQITQVARQRGLIGQDETIEDGRLSSHRPTNRPHTWPAQGRLTARTITYTEGTAQLTVRKSPEALAAQTCPDGWLFFGWASS
ncbi:hypothetical protein K1W54_06870 [Micromonospora sp. CPCC 205371]|nr:hypothetical protein [Micromonospora sp. CPCC 205371]